jgi:hypothetical protein
VGAANACSPFSATHRILLKAISLKFRLLSIHFKYEAFEAGRKMSVIAIFRQLRGTCSTLLLTMCSRCDGFLERRRVNSPYEYRDLVRQILETVEQGMFRMVSGTCSLEQLLTDEQWPADVITHVLECTTCLRRFRVGVETYHGSGGAWEVITSPSPPKTQ